MSEGQQLDASVDLSVNCKYKLHLNNELTFVNLNRCAYQVSFTKNLGIF